MAKKIGSLERIYTFFAKVMFIFFLFVYVVLPTIGVVFYIFDDTEDENIRLADGFDISAYNVILDVTENNTVEVIENITVNFTSKLKHGIYKFTPEWLEYTGKNGKTIKRKSIVTDYKAIGDEYTVDTVKEKKRIKIGSVDKYVDEGEKTYVIKYTYDMGKDPYKGFDEFIFHAYGDYWGTEIKNASLQVNMPKDLGGTNINFFIDKYREKSANEFVDYTINGNAIYAEFNKEKYIEYQKNKGEYVNPDLMTSLTVDIELPEGYFVDGSWNYGWISFIICLIIFAITLWNFNVWKKFGKDFPKHIETVEFYPPEKYSAAEIGYIYGKQTNKRLTISLIVQLASKGFIKIDEVKDKKREIKITNLLPKPVKNLSFYDTVAARVIKVKKLKEKDSTSLNKSELSMMEYLFKTADEKDLKDNFTNFLEVKDSLIQKGFIEVISDNEGSRFENFNKRKEEYDSSKKQYEIDKIAYNNKRAVLTELEAIVYDRLFVNRDKIVLSEHKTFYQAFEDVEQNLKKKLKDLIDDKKSTEKMLISIFVSTVVLILYLISFYWIEDMNPGWGILYKISAICIFINIYFTIIMKRKTKYGEEIIAKVNGFKNFLEIVEKEQLEELVLENPDYFYDILPYTYVLNISKKWMEKFENIPVPQKDMGTYDFSSFNSFNNLYSDVYHPKPVSTSSGCSSCSSGCSSCGGGCSSCGGGCSSCGGGGSW